MRISRQKLLATVTLVSGMALVALPAFAITLVPDCARTLSTTPPGLSCVEQAFRNIASLIVAITGSFALLMFVYGGFTMIISQGNEKKVTKGKTILTNAIIGIILIFSGGYIIDYIMTRLETGRATRSIGQTCNNGNGTYQTDVSGVIVCQTACSRMASQGYACMDPALGQGCNETYIGCSTQQRCCLPTN